MHYSRPLGVARHPFLVLRSKTHTHTELLTLNMLVFLCLSKFPSKNGHLKHRPSFFFWLLFRWTQFHCLLTRFVILGCTLSEKNQVQHLRQKESTIFRAKQNTQSSPCWFCFLAFFFFRRLSLLFLFTIPQHYWFWLELGKGARMLSRQKLEKKIHLMKRENILS